MIQVLENLIDRVAALPKEAQEEVVRSVLEIEQRHMGVYQLDDEERADILAALEEVKRGEVATDDEAAAVFKPNAVIERIEELCEKLSEFPAMGHKTEHPHVRALSVVRYPYVIYYTLILEADEVLILRVRYGRRRPLGPRET